MLLKLLLGFGKIGSKEWLYARIERERDGGGWGLLQRSMDASVLLDWRDQREIAVFRSRSDLKFLQHAGEHTMALATCSCWAAMALATCMRACLGLGSMHMGLPACLKEVLCACWDAQRRYRLDMQVGDITEHANFVVFDKEAQKLIKVLGTQLSNMEEEDVDGDNIIPNSINCIIGKTYIFQVKVTAYNFFVRKQNFRKQQKEGLRMEMKYPKKQSLLK
uniref:Replication factor A C-terminal domain-containing protein n=1 Tax=Quercus lobata TaxID=97700 RepID=A0A7N2KKG9_QUELO